MPGNIDFGNVVIGISAIKTIKLKEIGHADLEVNFISITGEHSSDFSKFESDFPLIIYDNGESISISIQIGIKCTPSGAGLRTAQLQLSSNDPNQLMPTYQLSCFGEVLSSDELAHKFAPVLRLSGPGVIGVDLKKYDHPFTDYIPINVNDITTSSYRKYPLLYKEDFAFNTKLLTLNSNIETIGSPKFRSQDNYIDFSPIYDFKYRKLILRDELLKIFGYTTLTITPTVYYRVFHDPKQENAFAIQYWFFYFYNDWVKNHDADWETITIFLDKDTNPVEAVYSTHNEANRHSWSMIKINDEHPIVYISNGGHGSYNHSGNTK